ncbi:MAG: hypothetical protein DRG78_15545 [Epsilonproteobacteria bacterium]|nr:MAG: hypothetical protein DRG78_15545 [Campylobacterota bacterium]
MKLIIREYLASLRERDELDALLPDLLSQMGLDVFSKPGVGGRQYGVDIAAYGSIDGGPETVYLFSVKAGDLSRVDWNGGSVQALRPSLDDILDTYIPNHLPTQFKDKPIEICLSFGGSIKEVVRQDVTSYEKRYTTDKISFSEWNGEKIAMYIEQYLLREELLPKKCRQLLRKSLALLDEPDSSYNQFKGLVTLLSTNNSEKSEDTLTAIRQLYICLWILYAWCREEDNLESAYLASELTLLHAWDIGKPFFGKKKKLDKAILETISAIQVLHIQISNHYIELKIFPHTGKLYALSSAVNPSSSVDVNIKLFDLIGRLALSGLWTYWYLDKFPENEENSNITDTLKQSIVKYQSSIKQLIINNPMLFTPYRDDQAIDIYLVAFFLAVDKKNHQDLYAWLSNMIDRIHFLFQVDGSYPCNLQKYHELIEHPKNDIKNYREDVTVGSILYPTIAVFSGVLGFDDIYSRIQGIKTDFLEHCNFQAWYPDSASEERFYKNTSMHGATLSDVCINQDQDSFLDELFGECDESTSFNDLSAMKMQHWPIIFLACRHYRLPIPLHFLYELRKNDE